MAKTKKKTTPQDLQKQASEKHKKEYFKKMKYMINSYSLEDVYSYIPPRILDAIYEGRHLSVKFEKGPNQAIEPKLMNFFNTTAISHIKTEQIYLQPSGNGISMFDYLTVYKTLVILKSTIESDLVPHFKGIEKLKISLLIMANDTKLVEDFNASIAPVMHLYALYFSDIRKNIYSFSVENIHGLEDSGDRTIVLVNSTVCKKQSFCIDGSNRPAYKFGWSLYGKGWVDCELEASLFNIKHQDPNHKIKVYIQPHAIERLHERTDAEWIGVIQFDTFHSFQKPVVTHDDHHNFLIEYRHMEHKIGYFVANIVDGCVFIRTFLFITNTGTPEGKRLEKLTGLKKLDKKYLAIDRMSTFMNSDLAENPEIQKLLANSNCQSVIDLYYVQKDIFTADKSASAEKILKYLRHSNN